MLQSTRNSTNIEEAAQHIADEITKAEKWAEKNAEKTRKHIEKPGTNTYTYTGNGYIAAATLYWADKTLTETEAEIQEADTHALYTQPYTKPGKILHISTEPGDPALIRLADASRWTGWRLLAVTPPNPPTYKNMLRDTDTIETPRETPTRYTPLYTTILALKTIEKQVGNRYRGPRAERLAQHIKEGFADTAIELAAKYRDEITSIQRCDKILIASTKFLEPAANHFADTLLHIDKTPIPLYTDNITARNTCLLLLATGVDQETHRRKRFKATLNQIKTIEITINTDPLESYIYFTILALILEETLTHTHGKQHT